MGSKEKEGEDRENLWASVLSEVQTSRHSQLPSSKNLLVLGDKESGKTTLIAKLQGNEDPKKGAGLEYGYIDVRDEYRDDHTRLGHWILDGDTTHGHLLRFSLKESNFRDTTILLCVAMTTPWNVMDQLTAWATLVQDHIDKLAISAEKTKTLQNETIRRWQSYVEPGNDALSGDASEAAAGDAANSPLSSPTKRISRNLEQEHASPASEEEMTPLPENTLTRNLGCHLIVVVTKTDYMSDLGRDYDYKDEHFDFIQQSVRKFCLHYGATLFYTSVKEDKNCDLLYKYLVHRIYDFPFKTPALVVEKDAVFIPAGWDNEKKIAILYENMHSMKPDAYYTDIIARPIVRKSGLNREVEVTAEDEQQFLLRQQQYLLGGGGGSAAGAPMPPIAVMMASGSPSLPPGGVSKQAGGGDRKISAPQPQLGSPKKMDPGKSVGPAGATTSEGVLANFFNSLLSKKTAGGQAGLGGPGAPPGSAAAGQGMPGSQNSIKPVGPNDEYNKAAMRTDAQMVLDGLTRNQKKVSTSDGLNNSTDC